MLRDTRRSPERLVVTEEQLTEAFDSASYTTSAPACEGAETEPAGSRHEYEPSAEPARSEPLMRARDLGERESLSNSHRHASSIHRGLELA